MRNLLILFVAFTAFSSCKKALKDVNDYFPKVKTISATVQADGSVLLKGELESEGESPVLDMGFCYDTQALPELHVNQIRTNESFEIVAGGPFDPFATYYFRTWARNDFGYAYGNVISLSNIEPIDVTPPCTITPNYVRLTSTSSWESFTSISPITLTTTEYEVDAYSNSNSISFTFSSIPGTGIYTTNSYPDAGKIVVSFYSGFVSGTLSSGHPIYINRTSPTSFELSICDAPWLYNSSTFYFNCRMTVNN